MWDWGTYFLFGFSLIWASVLLREYGKRKRVLALMVIALLPLFCLHAFRGLTVGTDIPNYMIHVEDGGWFLQNDSNPPVEFLSNLLYYASHQLGSFYWFLFLSSLIEYVLLAIAVRELYKRGIDGMVVFVLVFSYMVLRSVSMIRNGIALSATLCAYAQFLSKDNKTTWKYWIYSLIALGFHNSAIINVPIFFICRPIERTACLYKLRMVIRIIAIIILGFILFYIGQSGMLELFFRLSGDIYNMSHFEERGSWGIGNFAVRIPFLLLFLYSIPKMRKAGYDFLPFLMLLLFDIVVSQTKYISQDFERLAMYSGLGEMIAWGLLYKVYSSKHKVLTKLIFILLGIAFFSYYMYIYAILGSEGDGNGLMPYQMWLSLF